MVYTWRLNFGTAAVNDKEDTVTIDGMMDYENFNGTYGHLITVYLSKDSRKLLKKSLESQGKPTSLKKAELTKEFIRLFNKIEQEEGTGTPLIAQAAYEPGEAIKEGSMDVVKDSGYKIVIQESVDLTAAYDGTLQKSTLSGKLQVANKAEKDRIWDIDLKLTNTEYTDIAAKNKAVHITELGPDNEWTMDYKIKTEDIEKPPLRVTEQINTWIETEEENHTFILNKEVDVEFTLVLENTSKVAVTEIELVKEFPANFKKIKDTKVQAGDMKIDDGKAIWRIAELGANSSISAKVQAKVNPESTDPIPTGTITAKYNMTEGTFSGIDIESADGFSLNIFSINKDERDEQPDTWDCSFVFQNKSEFPMLLENIDILSGDVNTEEKAVKFEPRAIILPKSDWRSESWELKSEDVPSFGKRVLFTLLPDINKTLSASLTINPIELYVLSFKGKKAYATTEIPSFRVMPIKTVNNVWSEGPVDIESFVFEDKVPEDFRPPRPETIKLFINEKEIDRDNYYVDITPSVDYEATSYPREHTIIVTVENVQDLVEPGSALDIKMAYEITAIEAKPDQEYRGDCVFKAYTIPRGPEIELVPEDIITTPIKVVHIRRKETAAKAVFPGSADDEYEILLSFRNRGNTAISEKVIADQIPSNFKILSMDPEGETSSLEDATKITWAFTNVEPDQELEIRYVIKGTGDYEAGQTEVFTMD